MLWIGLTGGIATGKSTVSGLLVKRGYPVVDADVLAREASQKGSPGFQEIVQTFGSTVVKSDGELDRGKLAELVFQDREKLAILEGILHPRVRALAEEKRRKLERSGAVIAFYDVPLLFEKKMVNLFDRVLVVGSTEEMQLARLKSRNQLSDDEAKLRIHAQLPIAEKMKLANDVIENVGTKNELELAVDRYLLKILGLKS